MPKHLTESVDGSITSTLTFTTGTCAVSPGGTFKADEISEYTTSTGVSIDGVHMKDYAVRTTGLTVSGYMSRSGGSRERARYYVDTSETDHGVAGGGGTVSGLCTTIGTSKYATIVLTHSGTGNTTAIPFGTAWDGSSYSNITFDFERGAQIQPATGITGVTLYSPSNIKAQPNQQIVSGTSFYFSSPGIAESGWGGSGASGLEKMLSAVGTGGGVRVVPGIYEDVTVDEDDRTLILSEGVVFKTSSSGLVPAIKFSGCDRVEVQGRLVADGNKDNNAHAYTAANIGYAYAMVAFYNSTYLQVGDIYAYNAWHDGITLDTVTFSNFGNMVAKDANQRGVAVYQGSTDNHINNIFVSGVSTARGVRIGGASGVSTYRNHINSIIAKNLFDGVYIENNSSNTTIDNIIVDKLSAGNGVKIDDAKSVSINSIQVNNVAYNGVLISSVDSGTSNVNIGQITAIDSGTTTGTYCGVFIYAASGATTEAINIGQIIAKSNGTNAGSGLLILNDGSSVIQEVSIGRITANNNFAWGVFVDDSGTNKKIALGDVIASGNGTGAFRVEYGVSEISWGKLIVDNANNEMGVTSNLFGNRIVLAASNGTISTIGAGEDDLYSTTIGSGVLGATGGIHLVGAGTKTNANGNKTLKLHLGGSSWTIHPASNNEAEWFVEACIFNSATASQRISIVASGTSTTSDYAASAIVDTAVDVTLKITGECADVNDIITQTLWFVERL